MTAAADSTLVTAPFQLIFCAPASIRTCDTRLRKAFLFGQSLRHLPAVMACPRSDPSRSFRK